MRRTDERCQREVGLDHRRQRRHVAGLADSGLDHREPVRRRVEPGEGERDAQMVVQIALSREHRAIRGRGVTQNQREQILGRSFPRASGNADDRTGKCAAMLPGDGLKRQERVGDDELRQSKREIGDGDQRRRRAGRCGRTEKIMAVARRSFQRHEDFTRMNASGIDGKTAQRPGRDRRPATGGPGGKLCGVKGGHQRGST